MKTFSELELIEPIQRALVEQNYHTPTPIQIQTIPPALEGRDILGCAQTGTGKTAAFALPILDYLGNESRKPTPNRPIALVLAPTRELAIQIGESFETYGRHIRLRHVLVYGGVNQIHQVRALDRGVHVLIATPGRLLDLMNQGYIDLKELEMFVLDEADRMLDMGFLPDLKRIIAKLPKERQSMFFSATMPEKIVDLSQSLLDDPVSVNVTPKQTSVERIEQQIMFVEKSGKQPLLQSILSGPGVDSAIVFTRTKRGANMVAERLKLSGIRSAAIHGNKSQSARQKALDAFKSGNIRVLVATDLAARGIDIDGVTHVINFDLPNEPESYVHRIGRTGRAGANGIAVSFCSSAEREDLRAIEKLIGKKVPLAPNQPIPQKQSDSRQPENREADSGSFESRGPRAPRTGGGSDASRRSVSNGRQDSNGRPASNGSSRSEGSSRFGSETRSSDRSRSDRGTGFREGSRSSEGNGQSRGGSSRRDDGRPRDESARPRQEGGQPRQDGARPPRRDDGRPRDESARPRQENSRPRQEGGRQGQERAPRPAGQSDRPRTPGNQNRSATPSRFGEGIDVPEKGSEPRSTGAPRGVYSVGAEDRSDNGWGNSANNLNRTSNRNEASRAPSNHGDARPPRREGGQPNGRPPRRDSNRPR